MNKNRIFSIVLVVTAVLQLLVPMSFFVREQVYNAYDGEEYKFNVGYFDFYLDKSPSVNFSVIASEINYYSVLGKYYPLSNDGNGKLQKAEATDEKPKGDYVLTKELYRYDYNGVMRLIHYDSNEERAEFVKTAEILNKLSYSDEHVDDVFVSATCRNGHLIFKSMYIGDEKICDFE